MAQQVVDQQQQQQIEWCLKYQWDQWSDLTSLAETWHEMDGIEREVFHLEWVGITEYWLSELQSWTAQGLLTPEQQRRYIQLSRLVAEQRPQLQALLDDDTAPSLSEPTDDR